jgi:hypothetical protein
MVLDQSCSSISCDPFVYYRIPNSNQVASWIEGEYLSPSDLLAGAPGSELPDTPSDALSDNENVSLK